MTDDRRPLKSQSTSSTRSSGSTSGAMSAVRPGAPPAGSPRRALLVSHDPDRYERLASVIRSTATHVYPLDVGGPLLELSRTQAAEVLVLDLPIPELSSRELVVTARYADSRWRHAGIVALSAGEGEHSPGRLLASGVNAVLPPDASAGHLRGVLDRLAGVSPRLRLQSAIALEIRRADSVQRAMCQMCDVSNTGALIRTSIHLECGTRVGFRFHIPGESVAISGTGEVVRTASTPKDAADGFAVRFLELPPHMKSLLDRRAVMMREQTSVRR